MVKNKILRSKMLKTFNKTGEMKNGGLGAGAHLVAIKNPKKGYCEDPPIKFKHDPIISDVDSVLNIASSSYSDDDITIYLTDEYAKKNPYYVKIFFTEPGVTLSDLKYTYYPGYVSSSTCRYEYDTDDDSEIYNDGDGNDGYDDEYDVSGYDKCCLNKKYYSVYSKPKGSNPSVFSFKNEFGKNPIKKYDGSNYDIYIRIETPKPNSDNSYDLYGVYIRGNKLPKKTN